MMGLLLLFVFVFVVHGFTFSRVTESIRRDIRCPIPVLHQINVFVRGDKMAKKRPTNRQINKLQNKHIDNSEILTTVNQLKNQPHD